MDPLAEQQFLQCLPQTVGQGELNHQEVRAYEAFVRAIAFGKPFPFVLSGKMGSSDIFDALGFAVIAGDSSSVLGIAQWIVLTAAEKIRLRERLEHLYPSVFAEAAQKNRLAEFAQSQLDDSRQ